MKKKAKITYIAIVTLFIMALLLPWKGLKTTVKSARDLGRTPSGKQWCRPMALLWNFASGDQYFNYLHDKDGYILLRHNGYRMRQKKTGVPCPQA